MTPKPLNSSAILASIKAWEPPLLPAALSMGFSSMQAWGLSLFLPPCSLHPPFPARCLRSQLCPEGFAEEAPEGLFWDCPGLQPCPLPSGHQGRARRGNLWGESS
ncbi:unnamed protein product [Eretmochelys imbricata]